MKKWFIKIVNFIYYTLICIILLLLVVDTLSTPSRFVEVSNMIVFLLICISVKLDVIIKRIK